MHLLNASQRGCMTDTTRKAFGLQSSGRPDRSIHPRVVAGRTVHTKVNTARTAK